MQCYGFQVCHLHARQPELWEDQNAETPWSRCFPSSCRTVGGPQQLQPPGGLRIFFFFPPKTAVWNKKKQSKKQRNKKITTATKTNKQIIVQWTLVITNFSRSKIMFWHQNVATVYQGYTNDEIHRILNFGTKNMKRTKTTSNKLEVICHADKLGDMLAQNELCIRPWMQITAQGPFCIPPPTFGQRT